MLARAYRPIVHLADAGIAGYEVLIGVTGEEPAAPAEWTHDGAAERAADVEAELAEFALAARADESPGLRAVTLSAQAVLSQPVQQALDRWAPLDDVVLIVSGPVAPDDCLALAVALERPREAGALVALHEREGGYPSLRRILRLRPDFIRVGAPFVDSVDRDDAKAAVVETLAALAARIDSTLIADDVPGEPELRALMRLGIPLAQGPFLGVAATSMGPVGGEVVAAIAGARFGRPVERTVLEVLEPLPSMSADAQLHELADALLEEPGHDHLVLVDERERPVALVERAAMLRAEPFERAVTWVTPATPLRSIARRAGSRPPLERFTPLVCCDDAGRYMGIVRVERLLQALGE